MKYTRCDKCGKEADGRNPEGFGEVLIDHKYYDLCEDCKRKVNGIIYTFDLKKNASLRNYINMPMDVESKSLDDTVEKMAKLAEKSVESRQDDGQKT